MELPLVLVEWADAWVSGGEPVTLADARHSHKPEIIHTLGWVLLDDETGISLANEYYDDSYRGRTFIPRGMIVNVQRFKLVKPRIKKA